MDKQHFDRLAKGVQQMKRHVNAKSAGITMRRLIETKLSAPDVRVILEAAPIRKASLPN